MSNPAHRANAPEGIVGRGSELGGGAKVGRPKSSPMDLRRAMKQKIPSRVDRF